LPLFEDAVLIDGGVLPLGYASDVDPFTGLDGFLEIAAYPFVTPRSKT
jgi:hypothetical protein